MASLRTPDLKRVKTVLTSILRSSLFLSYTCFGFVTGHCALRRLLGFTNYWTASLLPGLLSCLLAILLERRSRRSALATYVCTVVSPLSPLTQNPSTLSRPLSQSSTQ